MLPLLAITMGDPAGIGPETIVGAWQQPSMHEGCRPMVVGNPEILRQAVKLLGVESCVFEIEAPEEAEPTIKRIPCLRSGCEAELLVKPGAINPGEIDPRAGQAAFDAVVLATELALSGRVDGITTAPLNKAALRSAGHHYPGHTELLADLCQVDDYAMMLFLANAGGSARHSTDCERPQSSEEAFLEPGGLAGGLGVVHVTLHLALRDVFEQLTTEAVLAKCRLADSAMRQLNSARPRIGVCALNPHAGEQGLFGQEEREIIAPAVELASEAGLDVTGPLSTDTLMVQARDGAFDAVVAMYHDQGHIALKLMGMHRAVNITLGLPIVRTSVAHGTAFDMAWQGRADSRGMVEALRVAAALASRAKTTVKPAMVSPGVDAIAGR